MENLDKVNPEAPPVDNPLETPDPVAKRHAEQLAGSRAEAEKFKALAVEAYAKQSMQDSNVFLEIHSKDPKLANEVAKQLGYDNADEILSTIQKETKKGFTEEDIERIVSEREAKKEHEKALAKAEKILDKLPEELQEEAKKRFDKISKGQTLDEESAIEFAEMATLYVNKDNLRAGILDDTLAMLGTTSVGKSKKVSVEEPQYVVQDGKLVLLSKK